MNNLCTSIPLLSPLGVQCRLELRTSLSLAVDLLALSETVLQLMPWLPDYEISRPVRLGPTKRALTTPKVSWNRIFELTLDP